MSEENILLDLGTAKMCLNCKVIFNPKKHKNAKFCSDRCRKRYSYLRQKEAKKREMGVLESNPEGRKYY